MKIEGIAKNIVFSAFGIVILITGLVLVVLFPHARGILSTLPYVCIGIGAGIFGGNLGTLIKKLILGKNPKAAMEIEIEAKDERNIAISNKAKAKAYDLMQIVFGLLIIVFALMRVDMYVVLVFIAAYLFSIFSMVYYLNKYCKEM